MIDFFGCFTGLVHEESKLLEYAKDKVSSDLTMRKDIEPFKAMKEDFPFFELFLKYAIKHKDSFDNKTVLPRVNTDTFLEIVSDNDFFHRAPIASAPSNFPYFRELFFLFRRGLFKLGVGDPVNAAQLHSTELLFKLTNSKLSATDPNPVLQYLRIYFVELFRNQFKDRNSQTVSFDFKLKDIEFDQLEVSPKVAGQIIYILIEYLGDEFFEIPYFLPAGDSSDPITYACYKAGVIAQKIENLIEKPSGTD